MSGVRPAIVGHCVALVEATIKGGSTIVPMREPEEPSVKFDMSRAWNDATALLSANSRTVAVIAGVFFFLPYVLLSLMAPQQSESSAMATGTDDPDAMMQAALAIYAEIWWVMVLLVLLQAVGTLAIYALLTHRERPTVGEAIAFGFRGLLPFVGVMLLQALALMLALALPMALAAGSNSPVVTAVVGLLVVIAAAYLYTKFSLTVAVLGIERQSNPVAVLRRSWSLTKGNSLRLWTFYVLLVIAFLVVSAVVSIMAGIVFGLAGAEVALFGNGLVSGIMNALFVTILLAVIGAAYRQLSGGGTDAMRETFE